MRSPNPQTDLPGPSQTNLQPPPSWQRYDRREVLTPAIHRNLRHELKYAF